MPLLPEIATAVASGKTHHSLCILDVSPLNGVVEKLTTALVALNADNEKIWAGMQEETGEHKMGGGLQ
jgi:hypothetical protein